MKQMRKSEANRTDNAHKNMDAQPQAQAVPQEASKANFAAVLRHSGFRNLWIGQVVSQVGDYFAFLALMVAVSGFTDDPGGTTAAVSGVMIAVTLPRLLFGVLAGVFVDRWDRRRTMIASDVLRVGLALLLIPAFLSRNLAILYAITFALSSVGTLFNPAKGALIPKLVPKEQLVAANSLSQTSMMLANFVGPALAGATFALVGAGNQWVAFAINSVSFAVSAVAIAFVRVPAGIGADEDEYEHRLLEEGVDPNAGPYRRVWQELKVGLHALALNRIIATLTAVFAVTMLGVGALNVLWVTFLKTSFGFQQAELGWRISLVDICFFAGMVGASIAAGNIFSNLAPKWFIVWGLLGAGVFTVLIGYMPDYWLVALCMLCVGLFVAPINTGVGTLMQIVVPNRQLGRVGGGLGTVIDAATLVSMSMAGALGAALSIPVVYVISGLLCVLGGVLAWVRLPALTLQDKPEEPAASEDEPTPLHPETRLPAPIFAVQPDDDLVAV